MNISEQFLDVQRQGGDQDADIFIEYIFNSDLSKILYKTIALSADEIKKAETNPVISFLLNFKKQPYWFDEKRIIKGQQFFKKFANKIMILLGGLSLPYCYAASPGNKALYLSDKMRGSPGKRLVDTADFIISVSSPGGLNESNIGLVEINKLRLIHAIARHHILKSANWNEEWGMPINQEDMAGTNLAFSFIILRGLKNSGFMILDSEKENFILLWKYIGYLLGIEEELLPSSYNEAVALERTIRKRNFKKSEEGNILAQELLKYYKGMVSERDAFLLESQIRYWLGPLAADCLGLKNDSFKNFIVRSVNLITESTNFYKVETGSFARMIQNHNQMKIRVLHQNI